MDSFSVIQFHLGETSLVEGLRKKQKEAFQYGLQPFTMEFVVVLHN